MSTTETPPQHSIDLEVSGSELPLLKQILKRIKLNDGVRRVRIEIESDEPLLQDNALNVEQAASDADESEQDEPADGDSSKQQHVEDYRQEEEKIEDDTTPETETNWENIPVLTEGSDPYYVLDMLSDREQFLETSDVSRFTPNRHGIENSKVRHILDALNHKGLVERKLADYDRRKATWKITGKGHDALTKAEWVSEEVMKDEVVEEAKQILQESEQDEETDTPQVDESEAEIHPTDELSPDNDPTDEADTDDESADDGEEIEELVYERHEDAHDSVAEIDVNLNPDTARWHIIGVLDRAKEPLSSSALTALFEGTDQECQRGSVSAQLSTLYRVGAVKRADNPDAAIGYVNEITELGEEWLAQRVNETPGYGLRFADETAEEATDEVPATA